jgi:superfamily I DNA and/or RNA helicase
MVRDLLFRETGLSVGVVAFSEAQQTEIEGALEQLAAGDSGFAARLEQEYVREDDGQFNGLFVKNLENVQGDERDIMILSICYAPGRDGRMAMNFGPINQRGGEKRLNVISAAPSTIWRLFRRSARKRSPTPTTTAHEP